MAIREIYVGTSGPFLIDDDTDSDLLTDPSQVATIEHLDELSASMVAVGSSVAAAIAFGQPAVVGTSVFAARVDHTHGTPADPLTGGQTISISVVTSVGPTVTVTLNFTNGILTSIT